MALKKPKNPARYTYRDKHRLLLRVLSREDLSVGARVIYGHLYCLSGFKEVFITNSALGKISHRSQSTARYKMNELAKVRLIKTSMKVKPRAKNNRRRRCVSFQIPQRWKNRPLPRLLPKKPYYRGVLRFQGYRTRSELRQVAKRVTPRAWLVYLLIYSLSVFRKKIRARNQDIADYLGLSVEYVRKALKELSDSNLIVRKGWTNKRVITLARSR